MIQFFFSYASLFLASVCAFFRSQSEQAIVELALRQQLAAYSHRRSRPRLTRIDRAFWVTLSRIWPRWREVLSIVQPETVVRWHRKGFRLYWRSISGRWPGRPRISPELQDLIRRLATENDWRARKVQAELQKLGFKVSLSTVSRYLPKRRSDDHQWQHWMTFLRNHRDAIAAMDFLVVPTVRFKLLYLWFVIEHGRRQILHVNVTAHPTSSWTIQQLREVFPNEHFLRYLIHDNDSIFSECVAEAIGQLEIRSKRTAYTWGRSPHARSRLFPLRYQAPSLKKGVLLPSHRGRMARSGTSATTRTRSRIETGTWSRTSSTTVRTIRTPSSRTSTTTAWGIAATTAPSCPIKLRTTPTSTASAMAATRVRSMRSG